MRESLSIAAPLSSASVLFYRRARGRSEGFRARRRPFGADGLGPRSRVCGPSVRACRFGFPNINRAVTVPGMTDHVAGHSGTPESLITSTMPLVGHIVRETMGRVPSHVSRDDLTSAGLTALVQAAQHFDPERGVPFER